jgi:hypothetical protein
VKQNQRITGTTYRDMKPEIVPGIDVFIQGLGSQISSSAAATAAHAS